MARRNSYTPLNVKNFFRNYTKNGGNVHAAARAIGISEWTFYSWERKYPEVRQKREIVDAKMRASIYNEAVCAIRKHLREYNSGKKEIVEVEHYQGGTIKRTRVKLDTKILDRALARVDPKWIRNDGGDARQTNMNDFVQLLNKLAEK